MSSEDPQPLNNNAPLNIQVGESYTFNGTLTISFIVNGERRLIPKPYNGKVKIAMIKPMANISNSENNNSNSENDNSNDEGDIIGVDLLEGKYKGGFGAFTTKDEGYTLTKITNGGKRAKRKSRKTKKSKHTTRRR